jgi:hypothetical protein
MCHGIYIIYIPAVRIVAWTAIDSNRLPSTRYYGASEALIKA